MKLTTIAIALTLTGSAFATCNEVADGKALTPDGARKAIAGAGAPRISFLYA